MEKSQIMHDMLKNSIDVLYSGGLLLLNTNLGWCLGCDATNEQAINQLYKIRKTSDSKEVFLMIETISKIQSYTNDMPEIAWDLIDMSEKPLLISYPEAKNLPANIINPDRSIAFIVVKDNFNTPLCARFKKPIACIPVIPKKITKKTDHIPEEFKSAVKLIVLAENQNLAIETTRKLIKFEKGSIFKLIEE